MGQGSPQCCVSDKAVSKDVEEVDVTVAFEENAGAVRIYDLVMDKAEDADTDDSSAIVDTGSSGMCKSAAPEDMVAPADFGGSWLCTRVSGDVHGFMKDVGLGPEMCEAAKVAHYGAGRQMQNIAQVGNAFVVQNIVKEPVTMRFRAGAGLQSTPDQEGKQVLIDPHWDGDVLCVRSTRQDGTLVSRSRRYLEGDTMVLELTSPHGAVMRRIFERRPCSSPS
mmetsp:Transcript_20128/g.47112  ORF Transcript_20128/g.47112 Transcript_20128/m.47112 type:complete len:222 (+) Transcript_20128:83-748(+)